MPENDSKISYNADRLQDMRLAQNLSVAKLAKRARVAINTVRRIERLGVGNLENIHRICKVLRTTERAMRVKTRGAA